MRNSPSSRRLEAVANLRISFFVSNSCLKNSRNNKRRVIGIVIDCINNNTLFSIKSFLSIFLSVFLLVVLCIFTF